MKQTLTAIALAGTVALGAAGTAYAQKPEFNYKECVSDGIAYLKSKKPGMPDQAVKNLVESLCKLDEMLYNRQQDQTPGCKYDRKKLDRII